MEDGYEAFEEGFRSLKGLKYVRPVIRHVWESQLDKSFSEGARFACHIRGLVTRWLETKPSETRRAGRWPNRRDGFPGS